MVHQAGRGAMSAAVQGRGTDSTMTAPGKPAAMADTRGSGEVSGPGITAGEGSVGAESMTVTAVTGGVTAKDTCAVVAGVASWRHQATAGAVEMTGQARTGAQGGTVLKAVSNSSSSSRGMMSVNVSKMCGSIKGGQLVAAGLMRLIRLMQMMQQQPQQVVVVTGCQRVRLTPVMAAAAVHNVMSGGAAGLTAEDSSHQPKGAAARWDDD